MVPQLPLLPLLCKSALISLNCFLKLYVELDTILSLEFGQKKDQGGNSKPLLKSAGTSPGSCQESTLSQWHKTTPDNVVYCFKLIV